MGAEEIAMEEAGAVDFSDSELVYRVRDALLSVPLGDLEGYQELVGVLHHNQRLAPDAVALLVTSLRALSGAVACIDSSCHDSLLNSIFGMSMWHYGPDVMDALLELIVSLAANGYVDSCLDMLVSNFMPPTYLVDVLNQPRGQAKKEQVLSRIHTALEGIAYLMPKAASRLSTVVVQRMPLTFKSNLGKPRVKDRTQMFVENMLRLESGEMREFVGRKMLMAVMDMLIDLDVAIGWDDILKDDSCKGIFTIELEDEFEADEDNDEENFDFEPSTLSQRSLGKNVIADLLDTLMVHTCEHLELCANNNRLSEVFETLLDSFMATILNTYKSKFAQFVIFYACALDPKICGVKFAKALADRFICGDNPLTRMSAVAYLASYLARAKFLSADFISTILKRLVDWCLEYSITQKADMNPKLHRVFYSGCQAIMYILCFRMRSMMDASWLRSQLSDMPLEPILQNRLEPLKVCLPSIVEEFLKQAKGAQLLTTSEAFIFEDLLESDLSKDFGGLERLDMFFPFDPCLLKKCDRNFIRPNFIYWKHVRPTYEDDEDSSDEDIAEENRSKFAEDGMMIRSYDDEQDIGIDEFDYAMNRMSITPNNGSAFRFAGEQMRMPSRIRPSMSPESP